MAGVQFGLWDYLVFILMLFMSAGIGVFYACRGGGQRTAGDYLMAGRSMGILPISLSLLASFQSGISLIGIPNEVYSFGASTALLMIGLSGAVIVSSFFYLPTFYKLELTSAYEYLSKRFNNSIRMFGSAIFIIHMVLYMAIVTYAPALALSQVTGLHRWGCVGAIGGVCIFYTGIGGMKAVMWTDAAQIVVMYASMLVIAIKGCTDTGGLDFLWSKNSEGKRLDIFDFGVDPTIRHSVWSLILGGFFTWLGTYGTNQAQVQRFLTSPTERRAQVAVWLNVPGFIVLNALCCFTGLVLYAKYWNCDPVRNKQIESGDQMLPLFVMQILGDWPGLPGLFVAGVFSGALSTLSSGLNSLAAVTLEDFVKLTCVKEISEERAGTLSKILAVLYGVVSVALVAAAEQLGNITQATLVIFGMISGPVLGVFTLGMFFPWANTQGAAVGMVTSFAIVLWIGIGAQIEKPPKPFLPTSIESCDNNYESHFLNYSTSFLQEPVNTTKHDIFILYRLSYLWYSVISCLIVVVIGLLVSLASGMNSVDDVDPKLLSPLTNWLIAKHRKSAKKSNDLANWNEKQQNQTNSLDNEEFQLQVPIDNNHQNMGVYNPTFEK